LDEIVIDPEAFSPLGGSPAVTLRAGAEDDTASAVRAASSAVTIGVDRAGVLPACSVASYDVLLTTAPSPPAPWVSVRDVDEGAATLMRAIATQPIAASVLCEVLRLGEAHDLRGAIALESLAYSTLLGSAAFRLWRAGRQTSPPTSEAGPPVRYERAGDHVTLELDRPLSRNATTAAMRDALCEALRNVIDDPTLPTVALRGAGRCFSTGGELAEFGVATDLAQAHLIRSSRSPALLLDALGARATVFVHGTTIGAGVEIAASAARRVAAPDAIFWLPELKMGLIPGAGGTATLSRTIGRHRTAWLCLTGRRIGARQALAWGLVHQIATCLR
jgi:hypothetical protein